MVTSRAAALGLALGACTGETDAPEPPLEDCGWLDAPELEIGRDIAGSGLLGEATEIDYGNPPQGGAPYAPFQVRLHAAYAKDSLPRLQMEGTVMAEGVEIGSASQVQTFFCSNTGVHDGWWYGGEVHLRMWDRTLEELDGQAVTISVQTVLDGDVVVETGGGGTLRWTLGR